MAALTRASTHYKINLFMTIENPRKYSSTEIFLYTIVDVDIHVGVVDIHVGIVDIGVDIHVGVVDIGVVC